LRIAETLGDFGVAIRNVAPMPRIVTPCVINYVDAIELIVPIDIDIDAASAPVEVAPHRGTSGHPCGKR
jgi:hypothetical protein